MDIYIYCLLSFLFIILVFKLIKKHPVLGKIKMDIGLGGIIYGGLIAIYSLILAFVVIVVWQQYQNTGDRIETEATKLYNVRRATFGFKDTVNAGVIRKTREWIGKYDISVQDDDWPAMAADSASPKTQHIYDSIIFTINRINPQTEGEKVWYSAAVNNLYQFSEARHARLANKGYDIPIYMWIMLISGAVLIILFSIFLESNNQTHHLMKVLMMSLMIICCLLLVYLLDHPFHGALKLEPEPFKKIAVGNW